MKKKNDKIRKAVIIALLCTSMTGTMIMSGCNGNNTDSQNEQSSQISISPSQTESAENAQSENSAVKSDTKEASYDENSSTMIKLNSSSAEINGNGASLDGNTVNITSAGTYIISGTIDDGQIVISAGKDDTVQLVLNNANINSKTSSAIYAEKCGKTIIVLSEGTENTISDGSSYVSESSEESSSDEETGSSPNAAVFVKDDLTFTGTGTLTVTGNAYNGITSKDTLTVSGGTINVTAVHHGITGRDNLNIEGGIINVTSTNGDGLRSTYSDTDKDDKGHITIDNADITVVSGKDGIQAEKTLTINGGTITVTTGGGAVETSSSGNNFFGGFNQNSSSSSDSDSIKGLKATDIIINGGTVNIDAYDDSIHGNGDVTVSGGVLTLKTGDDGVHADNTLTIKDGTVTVSQSYEGLEATVINISGGTIDVTASDDGINAAGGNDNSGFGNFDGGRGFGRFSGQQFDMQNMPTSTDNAQMNVVPTTAAESDSSQTSESALNISGGTIYVNAQGDGVDSNSSMNISGGTVVVNGTTQGGNGILDHDGTMTVTGGTIIGSGTYDMLEMPSDSSTQKSVAVMFDTTQSAGTLVYITDSNGNVLTAMSPEKNFGCIVFSSADLKDGETYTVYTGGNADGESVHGYYANANTSGGTQYTTFTASDTVTYVNQNGNTNYSGMGGGMGGRGNMNIGGGNMTPPTDGNSGEMTPPDMGNNNNFRGGRGF